MLCGSASIDLCAIQSLGKTKNDKPLLIVAMVFGQTGEGKATKQMVNAIACTIEL